DARRPNELGPTKPDALRRCEFIRTHRTTPRSNEFGAAKMLNYLLHRLATIVPTLFFVSVLIFGLQQLLPGDPAMILAGEDRDPTVIAHLHQKLHLDEPLPIRYLYWAGGVLK